MKDVVENAIKNRMFFGTSIWKGFGEGFGRVLGGQKSRFSRFFRCFFEAKIQVRFGSQKNREKTRKKRPWKDFWVGPAECAASRGEKKRGVRSLKM